MGVKVKTITNKFPAMEKALRIVDGKKISVGVMGENAWLASIHEYGCRIRITDKMRAWLHRNGLHVKDSTTEIVIPERSFLRSGYDECRERVLDRADRALEILLDGVWDEDDFYKFVGEFLRDNIQDYAEDLVTPPKHPFTLERNGGLTDLFVGKNGGFINDIEYEVE